MAPHIQLSETIEIHGPNGFDLLDLPAHLLIQGLELLHLLFKPRPAPWAVGGK
ncbi:MAG: hypothetical protein NTX51_02555 [Verrucomicrobia bacterium]|nr:hypothetical protein [Verrucomicrobiota bacterium]